MRRLAIENFDQVKNLRGGGNGLEEARVSSEVVGVRNEIMKMEGEVGARLKEQWVELKGWTG